MKHWIFVAVLLAAASASAEDNVSKAREAFKRGSRLYDLQKFSEAAAAYEEAYQAKDDPALLFNIGQAYRGAKEYEKAIGAYKAFLRNTPNAPQRAAVEQRIAELQKLLEEDRKSQDRPPSGTLPPSQLPQTTEPPPPPPAPPERRGMKIAGYATVGVGAALVVVGAALVGIAYSDANSLLSGTYSASAEDRIHSMEISGGVLLGVGAAAVVGGAITAALAARQSRVRADATLLPNGAFARLTVGF